MNKINKVTPKIMPGFMELLPEDQILFNDMMDKIREVYEKYGYLPIDTPILEYSEILLAKAGGETETQIYRFNKGDTDISMRFDLTVPLARYSAQRQNELAFPFKRYQIGKVYRGERPQRGRFREFYQCDIDVIGENLSTMYDAEIPAVIYDLFKKLNFGKFTIRINNRKVLNGFFESLDLNDITSDVLRVIDKLEKVGKEGVSSELKELELSDDKIDKILEFIEISGSNDNIIKALKNLNIENEKFIEGVSELESVIENIKCFDVDESYFTIDLTIARGLNYYTGTVYETKLNDYPKLGSVCSGGRYDDLTKYYADQNLQGVGISIGLTRLFFQLKDANIIESKNNSLLKALIIPFGNNNLKYAISLANKLREEDLICDVYYTEKGLKPKLKYANRLKVPYICLVGEDEEKEEKVTLKNMETGEQKTIYVEELIKMLKNNK